MTAGLFVGGPAALGADTSATGLRHLWTPAGGGVLDLTDPYSPIRLGPGIRGLWELTRDRYTSTSPAVPGARRRGHRVRSREGYWPLKVYGSPGQGWLDNRAMVRRALTPEVVGRWTVIAPNGQARYLDCVVTQVESLLERAPEVAGFDRLGVDLIADEQPYWQGEAVSTTLSRNGSGYDTGSITNPGDAATGIVWTVFGPMDSRGCYVQVNGATAASPADFLPLTLTVSQAVIFDQRAVEQSAQQATVVRDNAGNVTQVIPTGVDLTPLLGPCTFPTVPPRATVPLRFQAFGVTATATLTPLYETAA